MTGIPIFFSEKKAKLHEYIVGPSPAFFFFFFFEEEEEEENVLFQNSSENPEILSLSSNEVNRNQSSNSTSRSTVSGCKL